MTKKILGYIFVVLGVVLVGGTPGRSDWQDFTPGVSPEDILPFWRFILHIAIGLVLAFLGAWMIWAAKRKETTARIRFRINR